MLEARRELSTSRIVGLAGLQHTFGGVVQPRGRRLVTAQPLAVSLRPAEAQPHAVVGSGQQ